MSLHDLSEADWQCILNELARASFGREHSQGRTVVRDLKTGSGSINRHHFCDNCLVRTHTEPAARPGLTFVRPGTLDNPSLFKPSAQIWVRSALKWAVQDGLKCYEQNIDDAPQMIAAWQESNSA